MRKLKKRIDTHYHIIPEPYVKRLKGRGITGSTYVEFPDWTPETALGHLDRTGTRVAITSLSTPGVWFGDPELARELSRSCNEFQARMMSDHPDHFGSFATLPLPDLDGALDELAYALDTLGHDGVVLLSDVDGHYLGHPDYEELFAELDRREAVVFIHPHDDPRTEKRYEILSPLLEWPIHTTRAALDLLYSGRLARYPKIRYILSHGGGITPFLAHRAAGGKEEELDLLRGLFYDTASPGEAHLAALQKFCGPERVLFGTDGGWTPPIQTKLAIQELHAFDGFSDGEMEEVEFGNACRLFPRFDEAAPAWRRGERPAPVRVEAPKVNGPRPGAEWAGGTDIHHHMLPPDYLHALQKEGVDTADFPEWTPHGSLRFLEERGLSRALLSISSPGVWLGDDGKARRLARRCNQYAADLAAEHPDRFGGLAALPVPNLRGSVDEAAYALDVLGLDGVLLFSSVDGLYVGDPELDPLMAELNRRNALVLLHPNHLPLDDPNTPLHPRAEYPIDLTRAYARMVLNGVFVRFPKIRWVLAHAGGGVPFMAERLGRGHYLRKGKPHWWRILRDLALNQNSGADLASSVAYDTAEFRDPVALTALDRLVGPDEILPGTNYPWIGSSVQETTPETARAGEVSVR